MQTWYNVDNMRNRFTHRVHPKCALPRPSHKSGFWNRILKYLGCKCAGWTVLQLSHHPVLPQRVLGQTKSGTVSRQTTLIIAP